MNIRHLLVPSALVCCVATCGCGRTDAPPDNPEAAPPAAAADSASLALTAPDGTPLLVAAGEQTLPDAFPEDVPIPPDVSVRTYLQSASSLMVAFTATGSVQTVSETWQAAMLEKGWEADSVVETEAVSLLAFSKADRMARLIVTPDADGSRISLTVTTPAN